MNHAVAMVLAWLPAVVGLLVILHTAPDSTENDARGTGLLLVLFALVFFLIQGAIP